MIYHIATRKDWDNAVEHGIYFCESLETEGFIHCSTREQMIPVANRYHAGRTDLVLLMIAEKELSAPLKFESPDYPSNEMYPHIYGPLELSSIKQRIPLRVNKDHTFAFPDDMIVHRWWLEKPLAEMSKKEWESLCDGCARCCLYKLEDIETEELFYTDVACRFLDMKTCTCTDYYNRHEIMPTCVILTPDNVDEINWMPNTCAYRLLVEGYDLAWWHPLVTGKKDSTQKAGITINQFAVLEDEKNLQELEDHVQEWLNFI